MLRSVLLLVSLSLGFASAWESEQAPCSSLSTAEWQVPGIEIVSITSENRRNASIFSDEFLPFTLDELDFCDVTVILTHPGTDDRVKVSVWLPLDGWNGRFQATGGGGYATGFFKFMLGPAVKSGYAAASTDGGHPPVWHKLSWALKKDGTTDWHLMQNFASRSLKDMVLVGKEVIEQFYGKKPHHSYWKGCSTGGRQGHMMASKYPKLLDGVLAAAPAIGFPHLMVGVLWPQVVMKEAGVWLSNCELEFLGKAAMDACDLSDGVRDNVIADHEACSFTAHQVVGAKTKCDGEDVQITSEMADVFEKIVQGPRTASGVQLWGGMPLGTDLITTANISINSEGLRSGNPNPFATQWIRYALVKNPNYNISTIDYTTYMELWAQSAREYSYILGTEDPDLSRFRDAGGKLLSWHGINDQIIPVDNTIQHRQRVESEMGGHQAVNDFYRLFLAPGVGHCSGGAGAQPLDPLEQLVDWVEKGEAPEMLNAGTIDEEGELITRDVCLYPRKMKYMGVGDPKRASSWSCEGDLEEESFVEELNSPREFLQGLKQRFLNLGLI